jgi:chemotaxis protein CheC
MIITAQQKDSLTEVINIALGRAAASLSELTGHRVIIEVPQVTVCPINEMDAMLSDVVQGEIATVHQIFSGPVSGDALLLLDYAGALALTQLLTEGRPTGARLDAADREVLTEVGNILLNACMGTFGSMLQVHISFSVPRLQLDALRGLLDSLVIDKVGMRYALVIYATFNLEESSVGGYLLIALGVASLDLLLQAIDGLG